LEVSVFSRKLSLMGSSLARFAPEIITAITADLDLHARQKKSLRLADRKFFESRTRDIPCRAIEERAIQIADLSLADGRPRMPAEAVHMFEALAKPLAVPA